MKNKKTTILVFVGICLISITILIIINSNPQVEGWNDFKKSSIKNYSFVKDVNLDRITPPDFRIIYSLNRKIDSEEVNKVFLNTKNYILSEKVFEDMKKYHSKKYKYSFVNIYIVMTYWDNGEIFRYKIFSASDVDGEPSYDSFTTWYIEYNNEPTEIYNPKED